jgi:hypothetical protein
VYNKNEAGRVRVVYFDLVMLADESLKHQEDRKEAFNEKNNFGITNSSIEKRRCHAQLILVTIYLLEHAFLRLKKLINLLQCELDNETDIKKTDFQYSHKRLISFYSYLL